MSKLLVRTFKLAFSSKHLWGFLMNCSADASGVSLVVLLIQCTLAPLCVSESVFLVFLSFSSRQRSTRQFPWSAAHQSEHSANCFHFLTKMWLLHPMMHWLIRGRLSHQNDFFYLYVELDSVQVDVFRFMTPEWLHYPCIQPPSIRHVTFSSGWKFTSFKRCHFSPRGRTLSPVTATSAGGHYIVSPCLVSLVWLLTSSKSKP